MVVSIHSATLGSSGGVRRGRVLSETEAIAKRMVGGDVVLCGNDLWSYVAMILRQTVRQRNVLRHRRMA